MTDNGNRQAAPSARQRQEARRQGHVARSREFVFALTYAACGAALLVLGPALINGLMERLRGDLDSAWQPMANPLDHLRSYLIQIGWWLMPWLMALPVVAALAHWVQHGPLWLPERIAWDFARVDAARGTQRVFRVRLLGDLILGLLKIAMLSALACWLLREHWPRILQLTVITGPAWGAAAAHLLFDVAAWLGVGLLVWGGIDFAWQLFQHERELRMTPQEQREDLRAIHNHVSDPRPRGRSRQ
jgi:flagellar biosynthesis protein FlhB